MDTDNRILITCMSVVLCICSLIYAVGNMLQCLAFAQNLFIKECTCAYGAECIHVHASPVSGGGGGGGGGGGAVDR